MFPRRSRKRAAGGLLSLAIGGAFFGARFAVIEMPADHPGPARLMVMQTTAGGGSLASSHGQPRDGTWVARGRVLADIGGSDEPPGTQLTRRWTILEHCDAQSCRPWLHRDSAAGFEEAPLIRGGTVYRAVFDVAEQGCGPPSGPSGIQRVYLVSVDASGNRLHAIEVMAGAYQGCARDGGLGFVFSTLRWDARFSSKSCAATVVCRQHVGGSAPGRGRII